jgi:hypothetical protein
MKVLISTKILFIYIFCLFINPIFGQSKSEIFVKELDQKRFAALVDKNYSFLESVLADDLSYVHSSGKYETKKEYLSNLKSGELSYLEINVLAIEPKQYSKNLIVNRGKLKLKVSSENKAEQTFSLIFTDIFEKKNGNWKLVSWQSTRLPN